MNVALSTPDILHQIFHEITEEIGGCTTRTPADPTKIISLRKTLLHSALTCWRFYDPALDALYRRLDGILPLLRLLPMLKFVDDVYVLTGHVSSNDLTCFKAYASRVRELSIHESDPKIHSSVYLRLVKICGRPLPSLRVFTCYALDFTSDMLIFITPTLSRVEIDLTSFESEMEPDDVYGIEAFIDTLVDEAPRLQHLQLHAIPLNCRVGSVKEFKNLRTLDILCYEGDNFDGPDEGSIVPSDTYQAFSSMERLIELKIDVRNLQNNSGTSVLEFQSLEKISLTGPLPLVSHTLSTFSARHLWSVDIHIVYNSTASEGSQYRSFFALLVQSGHLRRLTFLSEEDNLGDSHGIPFEAKQIYAPLLQLKQLEYLSLSYDHAVVLMDDTDVSSIALAFPGLQTLHLASSTTSRGLQTLHASSTTSREQSPTIGCLIFFARHCPALSSLRLPINSRADLPLDPPVFSHGLDQLCLVDSLPENLLKIARFIDGLFPNLGSVNKPWTADTSLNDIVDSFQNIRKDHERRLAASHCLNGRDGSRERGG